MRQKHNSTNILTNEFATKKLHNYVTETWDQSGKLISPILVLPLSRRQVKQTNYAITFVTIISTLEKG